MSKKNKIKNMESNTEYGKKMTKEDKNERKNP